MRLKMYQRILKLVKIPYNSSTIIPYTTSEIIPFTSATIIPFTTFAHLMLYHKMKH